MLNEINTVGDIQDRFGNYWSGYHVSQCLTKAEILTNSDFRVNGDYGNNECPKIDDIVKKLNNTIKFYKTRVDSELKYYTCSAQLPVQTDFPFTIHTLTGTSYEASYGVKLEKGSMAWGYEFLLEIEENIVRIDYTNFSDDYYNYIFTYTL